MRTVTYRLDDLKDVVIHIGRAEENLATRVRIDAGKVFAEYPAAVPTMKVINPAGTVYGREVSRDGDLVIWDVTESDLAAEGQGEMQLTFTENSVIVKSADARTEVCRSISGGTTPPDPVQDWIDRAEEVLEEVEDAFPEGGTTGQVLAKKSNADFDTEWVDQGSGGTTDYAELTNKPKIAGVTLTGNKSLHDLGAAAESDIPDVSGFYTKPAGGIPASDIADGVIPDPEDLIDDTAGAGDTDKTWSADKLTSDVLSAIQQKQDAPATAGTSGQVLGLDANLDPEWKTVSGGGIVDDDFSTSSTNPVQNKVITNAVNKINSSALLMNTAYGNPAVFVDGADGLDVVEMDISFSPIQTGTGDPSPQNVRSITQWDGVDIMHGSSSSEYDTESVDFGQNVAGGHVDVVSGELYQIQKRVLIKDLSWTYYASGEYFFAQVTDKVSPAYGDTEHILLSSMIKYGGLVWAGSFENKNIYQTIGTNYLYIKDTDYSSVDSMIGTYGNGELVYYVQTPSVIATIAPTIIRTLKGENRVWSDANGILSIKYMADAQITQEINCLLSDNLSDCTTSVTKDASGNVTGITYTRNGTTIRTDTIQYGSGTITETRTGYGKMVTITTNLSTLATEVEVE